MGYSDQALAGPPARVYASAGLGWRRAAVFAVLLAASLLLLLTAPVNDDFWWQDAPRHALNGAFVKDFFAALPWRDPLGWAASYYIKYPSLTIGFYPPLFYVFEAGFFAVFGVSQFVAQATVACFTLLLGFGAYRLARLLLAPWAALGVALMLLGAPEMAVWGRQVMLDTPVQAAVLLAVFCFARYLVRSRPLFIYAAIACFVAALYLKFTAVFIALPFAVALLLARGWRGLSNRHLWIACGVGAVASVPAVLLTLKFGAVNVDSVTGHVGDDPITSLRYWLFYLRAIPAQIGLVPTVFAAMGVVAVALRRPAAPKWLLALTASWFVTGYLFFSGIHQHEFRHDLMILFPVLLCAGLGLQRWPGGRAGQAATLALGVFTLVTAVLAGPPPTVRGYRQVTDYVAANAPPGGIVVYSGYRDGNFVFGMREHADRSDLTILRADKLLLRMAVNREWGVQQAGEDESAILQTLKRDGAGMIVAQRGFWEDLAQMQRFANVLHSGDFRLVASFDITGTLSTNDGRDATHDHNFVDVYLPTYPVPPPPATLDIDVPFVGAKLHGVIRRN